MGQAMADSNVPICFHCGQPSRTDRFNRLADGRQCSACCERLLATLAPLLPGGAQLEAPDFIAERHYEPELDRGGDIPA